MIIDNFDAIRYHLKFEDETQFYFVQIIQRKKDGCFTESGNNGYRVIKSYYIKSLEEWDRRKAKIIELCEQNHARAYVNINRRSTVECCWEAVEKYMELIRNNHTHQGYKVWDHACGISKSPDKLWMVDVDNPLLLTSVLGLISQCRGTEDRIKFTIPTAHGFHIVTSGFDLNQFHQLRMIAKLPDIDIHKQGIILLYFNYEKDVSSND